MRLNVTACCSKPPALYSAASVVHDGLSLFVHQLKYCLNALHLRKVCPGHNNADFLGDMKMLDNLASATQPAATNLVLKTSSSPSPQLPSRTISTYVSQKNIPTDDRLSARP